MKKKTERKPIPIYGIDHFKKEEDRLTPYQVEKFDAYRHFNVEYPHRHDFFEILYLNKGEGKHIIDENKYEIKPPCVFFLSPGQSHELELSEDVEGYIFLFRSEFYLLNKVNKNELLEFPFFFHLEQKNEPLYVKSPEDVLFMESLFKKGSDLMKNQTAKSQFMIEALLENILRFSQFLYPEKKSFEAGPQNLLIKRFYQLLEEKYQLNLSVKEYAEALNVSPDYLTELSKEKTGKTSTEIIKAKLNIEIKRLLIHSDLHVSEIAQYFNFKDQSYFSRFFKRLNGISPKEYKENNSGKST